MIVEIELYGGWNSDYWTYSLCDRQNVHVLSNDYQTIEFNFSLNGHYYEAFHQLDATLFNMSDQQTLVCVAISFVLMSSFVIIGFKQDSNSNGGDGNIQNVHKDKDKDKDKGRGRSRSRNRSKGNDNDNDDNNDTDNQNNKIWIYCAFLLYSCLVVVTCVIYYFFHIYVIGLGCDSSFLQNKASHTLAIQFTTANSGLTALLIPHIMDLCFTLQKILNRNKLNEICNSNTQSSNGALLNASNPDSKSDKSDESELQLVPQRKHCVNENNNKIKNNTKCKNTSKSKHKSKSTSTKSQKKKNKNKKNNENKQKTNNNESVVPDCHDHFCDSKPAPEAAQSQDSDHNQKPETCCICIRYEKLCNSWVVDRKFAWNLWLLTPTMLFASLFIGVDTSDALLGIIESTTYFKCVYASESCTYQYVKDTHRFIVDMYSVALVEIVYYFMVRVESRIYRTERGCKCYCCLFFLTLACIVVGVLCGITDVSQFPNVSFYKRDSLARKEQRELVKQRVTQCWCVCYIIWGIRALSMMLGCVISKYFFIGWYFTLVGFYLYDSIMSQHVTYVPLFIVGTFIIVLIFFHDFNCNEKKNNDEHKNSENKGTKTNENCKSKNPRKNKIAIVIISIFLQLLDVITDYNLTYQWLFVNPNPEFYIYATIQLAILVLSQTISMCKMGNVDEILIWDNYDATKKGKKNTNKKSNNSSSGSKPEIGNHMKFSFCDKLMTCIGFGRSWMAAKLIKQRGRFYGEYINLKVYELCLESIPSVILQLYIVLVQAFIIADNKGNFAFLTLMASIIITMLSVSFSIWRVFASNTPQNNNDDKTDQNSPDEIQLIPKDDSSTPSPAQTNITRDGAYARADSDDDQKDTDREKSERETKQVTYSKFLLFVIYVLICCDLYIRGFPFIFGAFVVRLALEDNHESSDNLLWIYIAVMLIGVIVIGIYEYKMLKVIKQDKCEKTNGCTRIQQTFMSYFTCLLSLLSTLPLKRFRQKNNFNMYAHDAAIVCFVVWFYKNTLHFY